MYANEGNSETAKTLLKELDKIYITKPIKEVRNNVPITYQEKISSDRIKEPLITASFEERSRYSKDFDNYQGAIEERSR